MPNSKKLRTRGLLYGKIYCGSTFFAYIDFFNPLATTEDYNERKQKAFKEVVDFVFYFK